MYLAYIPKFYWDNDTVIFAGDSGSLSTLAAFLRSLSERDIEHVRLSKLPFVFSLFETDVSLQLVTESTGMLRVPQTNNHFVWHLARETCIEFANMIQGVADSEYACHQYLDTFPGDEVQVMVSKGEYDLTKLASE
jgi:hypothetical protein